MKDLEQLPGETDTASLLAGVQSDYQDAITELDRLRERFLERQRVLSAASLPANAVQPPRMRVASSAGLPAITARLFGTFEFTIDGRNVTDWESKKARTLCKFLVFHRGRHMHRDQILESLWPDADVGSSSNSLRVLVHGLRGTLSKAAPELDRRLFVLHENESYSLNPQLQWWVDTDEFQRKWDAGRRLLREKQVDLAVREFESAEAVYRGHLLEDEPYEEWTLLPRENLHDIHMRVLTRLAILEFERGDYESCLAHAHQLVEADPCREEAYRWLIRCHGAMGQIGRARHWYAICTRTLARELDLKPSRETVEIYRAALRRQST